MKDQTPDTPPKHRLLIYQTDPALSNAWTDHLLSQSPDYLVRRTADRREAQAWLRDETADCCALDLADAADVDFFFDLRMALPGVRTLLTTARPVPKIVEDLALTGATIHFMNPRFSPTTFQDAVARSLEWGSGAPPSAGQPETESAPTRPLPVPRQTQRISGNLKVLLPDLVQLKCLTGSSCVLEIFAGQDVGEVFFERGNIVHSRTPALTGVAALVALFSWRNSHFQVHSWREPETRSIRDRWESLLLDVSRQVDEMRERAGDNRHAAA